MVLGQAAISLMLYRGFYFRLQKAPLELQMADRWTGGMRLGLPLKLKNEAGTEEKKQSE